MKYVEYPEDRPDVRLSAILAMDSAPLEHEEQPTNNIDRLYTFIFNGVKFPIENRDVKRKTQNCGICVLGVDKIIFMVF